MIAARKFPFFLSLFLSFSLSLFLSFSLSLFLSLSLSPPLSLSSNTQDKLLIAGNEAIQKPAIGATQMRTLAFRLFLLAERDEQQSSLLRRSQERYAASVRLLQVYRGLWLEGRGMFVGEIEAGTVEAELEQVDEKSKYAKWRISELKKMGDSNDDVGEKKVVGNEYPPITQSNTTASPPAYNLPLQQPILSPSAQLPHPLSLSQSPTLLVDPKIIAEAEKQARFAISAMHFDDLPTAIQNLQRAIALLQSAVTKRE